MNIIIIVPYYYKTTALNGMIHRQSINQAELNLKEMDFNSGYIVQIKYVNLIN